MHPCPKQHVHKGHRLHNSQKELRASYVVALWQGPHVLELEFGVKNDQEEGNGCDGIHERHPRAVSECVHRDEADLRHCAAQVELPIQEEFVSVVLCVRLCGESLDGWH